MCVLSGDGRQARTPVSPLPTRPLASPNSLGPLGHYSKNLLATLDFKRFKHCAALQHYSITARECRG